MPTSPCRRVAGAESATPSAPLAPAKGRSGRADARVRRRGRRDRGSFARGSAAIPLLSPDSIEDVGSQGRPDRDERVIEVLFV
jgi:hypothetical protein